MTSMQRRMARGAAWMFAARWVDKLLGLVSTLVLARLLVPEDFGIVAVAMAIVGLLEIMTNFGFDSALIQHQAPTRKHYDTVWTITLLFGLAVAVTLGALSVPIAVLYDDPRMTSVTQVIALGIVITSLRNVGCVDFRRDLEFHKEFLLGLYRRVLTVPLTIWLAFWLQSYWALVLGTLFAAIVGSVLTYLMHPFRPRWSLACFDELFGFSKWLFLSNLFQFVSVRSADFIIGKLRGPHELGLFSIANDFGSLPSVEVVAPINRAAFPGYSRLAGNREELFHTFIRVIGLIAIVVLPAGLGLAWIAPLFVPVVLGSKWVEAIPLLQLCALASVQIGMWTNTSYLFVAMGRPRVGLVLSAIQAAATLSFLLGFVLAGIENAAGWALFCAAAVLAVPNLYLWRYNLGLPWRAIGAPLWRPALGCVVMCLALNSVDGMLAQPVSLGAGVLAVLLVVGWGALVYAVSVLAAWFLVGRPTGAEATILAGLLDRIRAHER